MLSSLLLNVALCHCMIGARRFEASWCLNVLEQGPSSWAFWFLEMRPPHCLETSVTHQRRTEVVFLSFFYPHRSCVELNSTALFDVQGPMSSSYRHFIVQCFMLVSLTSCYPVAASELWKLEILGKMNLDRTSRGTSPLCCQSHVIDKTSQTQI
jgi:hypothetical protein